MLALNLPQYEAKITIKDGKRQIFDILRRSYVALTPEEWVRQHFVHYLINEKGYPQSLMANETAIQLNNIKLRCDTVVYDKQLKPRAIVEYKAPTVELKQEVFAQIARYNLVLKVDYLIVSNGIKHYCCKMDYENSCYKFVNEIPHYQTIAATEK
ncbi:MAG: type I restriction enzyme HsdR N-terminal domain-containing protein [Bacteroidaceae bacterium]|nr:type I restriction enzyme HsdR N-terminal domain-containing protein [Bacteroidaceae bacterium]